MLSAAYDAALAYTEMGWSVIPVHAPLPGDGCTCGEQPCQRGAGKHPATSGGEWASYQQRIAGPDELRAWFDGPPRNLGVVCGQVSGGLVVVDCDDLVTADALRYAYPEATETASVKTGKGTHFYFHATEPVKTTRFLLNGLTHHVKAEGSYVVAPPSVHASGRTYAWEDTILLTLDLVAFRAALARLGAKRAEETHAPAAAGWVSTLLREGARHGERDDQTTRLAGYLAPHLSYDEALAVLELWAARCDQPWGERDVRSKLDSVLRYVQRP